MPSVFRSDHSGKWTDSSAPHSFATRSRFMQTHNNTTSRASWIAVSSNIIIFFALCTVVLPYAGIQNDESLFTSPLYNGIPPEQRIRAFHHDVPLMLMSYLGTTKTWLYALIFRIWPPDVISLRIPPICIGVLTIWATYALLQRIAGRLAAIATCALLATDVTYVLTTTFDWGPVAIQHLSLTAGLLFVIIGATEKRVLPLGFGFLMLGLGMWDKAILIWVLSGVAIATSVLLFPQLRAAFTWRNLAAAIVGFSIGACPLIIYNIRNPLKTFQGNTVFSTEGLDIKFEIAKRTLNGSVHFGYLVFEEHAPRPKTPDNSLEDASVALRKFAGERRISLGVWAFCMSIAAVPLWWPRKRLMFFCLIVILNAWLQMAFTKDAGSGHHVILMWPFPLIVIAIALTGAAERIKRGGMVLFTAILTVLCLSNLLVYNQYLCQFVRNGAGPIWSDAILPLSDALNPLEKRNLFVVDWGMDNTLRMLHQGRLKTLWNADDVFSHELTPGDQMIIDRMLALKDALFITHTPDFEIEKGSAKRLETAAASMGYRRQLTQSIEDFNGRIVFEISRFVK